jgi:hypothetical protein
MIRDPYWAQILLHKERKKNKRKTMHEILNQKSETSSSELFFSNISLSRLLPLVFARK